MTGVADNLKAAALMSTAMVCFTTNDAIIKLLSGALPIGQILFVRGCLISLLLFGVLLWRGESAGLSALLDPHTLLRAVLEVGVTFTFLTGIARLPLADATTLIFVAPLFLTLIAAFWLREPVGWRRWVAVSVGFFGVVLIAQPGGQSWQIAALLPLAAAFLTAIRDTLTRMIPARLSATAVALTTSIIVTLGGLLTAPLGWSPLGPDQLSLLFACALLLSIAMTLLVAAVRLGEVSFVAPFRYVAILLAVIYGVVLWDDQPGWHVLIGASIIVGSGLFIFYREHSLAGTAR